MDPKESLGDEARTTYWSLLGGVAWLTQTRPDICVMVHALQRVAHNPSKEDATKLNSVLKYAKRKPLGLRYPKLPAGQMKLHLFSDAAYKVQPECTSGLSVRGSCLALMSTQAEGQEHLAGPALAAYTDARSVYDSIVVPDFHLPTEASQGLVLLSLRDEIRQRRIDINWVDTRWMLADALTKGSVSREQIVQASGGEIELLGGSLITMFDPSSDEEASQGHHVTCVLPEA
eukprot:4592138-Amphidinium_carterae.2